MPYVIITERQWPDNTMGSPRLYYWRKENIIHVARRAATENKTSTKKAVPPPSLYGRFQLSLIFLLVTTEGHRGVPRNALLFLF
jgi:hypothetical protein